MYYGLIDGLFLLLMAITSFLLNWFALKNFGNDGAVVCTIVICFYELIIVISKCFGDAVQPLVSAYNSENNQQGIKKLYNLVLKFEMICAVIIFITVQFFGSYFPLAFNITEPDLLEMSATGIKLFSYGIIFYFINMLFIDFYTYSLRIFLASFHMILLMFVSLISFAFLGASFWGLNGMWGAMAFSYVFSLSAVFLINYVKYPKLSVGLLHCPKILEKQFLYNAELSKEGIGD